MVEEKLNGEVAEELFNEMEVEKQKPKETTNNNIIESSSTIIKDSDFDSNFSVEGKTKKELLKRWRDNIKLKKEISKQITDLINKRKQNTEQSIIIRNKYYELAKRK